MKPKGLWVLILVLGTYMAIRSHWNDFFGHHPIEMHRVIVVHHPPPTDDVYRAGTSIDSEGRLL
jgi:hypothetical protein